ncbi:hypothetical protein [uncultured Vibrio sp.]|uniref:hypothetical protein n=1 Tax=uncultured Vibrio sp. TaxID=114054 RepID=UPI00262054C0|nr:hypothetical protein [uncultured Vibrio sp.]
MGKIKSLEATVELLMDIKNSPKNFDNDIINNMLSSQRSLAAHDDQERGILSSVLNTLKSNANKHLERGWQGVDELRLEAKAAIAGSRDDAPKVKAGTKKALEQKKNSLVTQVHRLEGTNMMLTALVSELRANLAEFEDLDTLEERQSKIKSINKRVLAKIHAVDMYQPEES